MVWVHWLLYVALPAIAVTLLLVGAFGPRLLALALALSVLAPMVLLRSLPNWPWLLLPGPNSAADWLVWLVCASGLVGALHDLRVWPAQLGAPPKVVLLLATPWLLSAHWRRTQSQDAVAVYLMVTWLALGLVWLGFRHAASRGKPLAALLLALLCLLADSVILWSARQTNSWYFTSAAAIAALVAMMIAVWRRPFVLGQGIWLMLAVTHGGAILHAHHAGGMSVAAAAPALLMPAPLWLASLADRASSGALGASRPLAAAILLSAALAALSLWLLRR